METVEQLGLHETLSENKHRPSTHSVLSNLSGQMITGDSGWGLKGPSLRKGCRWQRSASQRALQTKSTGLLSTWEIWAKGTCLLLRGQWLMEPCALCGENGRAGMEDSQWWQQNRNLTFLRVSGVDLSVHDITDLRPGFADPCGSALSLLTALQEDLVHVWLHGADSYPFTRLAVVPISPCSGTWGAPSTITSGTTLPWPQGAL